MSFSLAILSEEEEGIVLTGLHNRESSYVYAKPLKDGQSKYPLSPEEKEAVTLRCKKGRTVPLFDPCKQAGCNNIR